MVLLLTVAFEPIISIPELLLCKSFSKNLASDSLFIDIASFEFLSISFFIISPSAFALIIIPYSPLEIWFA